jgi:hypothetical protein
MIYTVYLNPTKSCQVAAAAESFLCVEAAPKIETFNERKNHADTLSTTPQTKKRRALPFTRKLTKSRISKATFFNEQYRTKPTNPYHCRFQFQRGTGKGYVAYAAASRRVNWRRSIGTTKLLLLWIRPVVDVMSLDRACSTRSLSKYNASSKRRLLPSMLPPLGHKLECMCDCRDRSDA